ncbi:hypothetical protein [Geminicoccus flavidas]|uniref:hypothetical protein n=1 Tax=Geminicoccus flavidas TaxID=2506407 RepID=UPI00135A08D8|nr:hypothetical protein [Geminicoccus flavidas]
MTGDDEADAPDPKEVVVLADPHGMFGTRKIIASGWAALEMASEPEDDIAVLTQLIVDIERDIVEFWAAEGLPTAIGCYRRVNDGPWVTGILPVPAGAVRLQSCRHPAERAEPGTWLARSWELWLCLEEVRRCLAEGKIHRFGRFMYILARKEGEIAAARRHGRAWRAGERTITGGTNAANTRFGHRRPMHNAWLERDVELQAKEPSERERARIIAEEWHEDVETVRKFLRRDRRKP